MYQNNPSGISYRVKSFLEGLGIQTTRIGRNRGRATSVKDVHSLRHTKHYQAHADREAKEKYLAKMPDFIGHSEVKNIESSENQIRTELIQKIQHMSLEQVIKVADFVEKLDM